MPRRLANYIRTHRKRSGLSQREIAVLVGSKADTKVSRYEQFRRVPPLQTAIALAIVFGVSVDELFGGLQAPARRTVKARAETLIRQVEKESPGRRRAQRLASLRSIRDRL